MPQQQAQRLAVGASLRRSRVKVRLLNIGGRVWLSDRRLRHIPLLVVLLVLGGAAVAATIYNPIAGNAADEASARVAADFVRNSPTFRFDGIEESFRLESSRRIEFCPGCYEHTFYFESRHPGVGDRTDVKLRPYITPHRAVLNLVDDTVVVMGVLDDSWDIGRQLIIDRE